MLKYKSKKDDIVKKLVIIIGSGAVGKMTVGQKLMEKTGLRLFHNHMMIEPVIEIFGKYDGQTVIKLRDVIFKDFLKTDNKGMIFTFMWAFDEPHDKEYIMNICNLFDPSLENIYAVELVADQKVRLERNKTENRLKNKASKRDLAFSSQTILNEDQKYRLVSYPNELPFKNYIKIDNTNLSPDKVADQIIEAFHLEQIK